MLKFRKRSTSETTKHVTFADESPVESPMESPMEPPMEPARCDITHLTTRLYPLVSRYMELEDLNKVNFLLIDIPLSNSLITHTEYGFVLESTGDSLAKINFNLIDESIAICEVLKLRSTKSIVKAIDRIISVDRVLVINRCKFN